MDVLPLLRVRGGLWLDYLDGVVGQALQRWVGGASRLVTLLPFQVQVLPQVVAIRLSSGSHSR